MRAVAFTGGLDRSILVKSQGMRFFSPQRARGFNLLEVTIAAFIFSVVSISFIGVWGQQVRALEKSRHVLVATFLAEELIEESMAKGYEQSKLTEEDEGPEEIPIVLTHETRDLSDPEKWNEMEVEYTATREIRTFLDPDVDKLKQVIVRVTWEDTTKTGEVVLETFLAGNQ